MSDVQKFDLDAARARRIEEKGQPLPFTFGGEDFEVLPPGEWDLEVPELLAQGELAGAFRILLGSEQYDRFAAHRPRLGDLESLAVWLNETAGGGSGN